MTITAAALAGGNFGDNATSATRSIGSVTAGQLVLVWGMKYSPSSDAFVAGDCTKSAGTATIGTPTLDRQDGGDMGNGAYGYSGLWSVIVTGSGTLTMQVGGAATGSYLLIAAEAFNGSWDSSRVDGTPTGNLDIGNSISSMSTGNITTTGAALIAACVAINNNSAATITPDGAFTTVYEQETVDHALGSAIYRIVSSGTTDAGDWTFTALDGSAGNGAAASIVAYKEAASINMPPQTAPERQTADLLSYDASPYALDWAVNVAAIVSTLGQASSTGATGRVGARGDSAAAHGAITVASGRAGVLCDAPSLKESPSAASGRAGVRAEVATVKAATTGSDGRLSGRVDVVTAEGAVHAAVGRVGARGSVATIPAFGFVTQAIGRAGIIGDANAAKVAQGSAAGRAGVAGSTLAAKGSAGGSEGRAGPRSDASAGKSMLHGASGSLAARGAALAAEGAVHSATGRIGVRASVSTAAAFGATTVAGGRIGARGSASSAKAIASDAVGSAGLLCNALASKALTLPSAGRLGARGLVDTSGIPPIETTADGRLGVHGDAITVLGGASSSGSSGVGRMVTPSYRLQPQRRKRRPGVDEKRDASVDLAPRQLAGTASAAASAAAATASTAAPAQPQPAPEADRWARARLQDLEFETKVLHLI